MMERRRSDHMTGKTMEIPGPALLHQQKSCSALPRDIGRIDFERGAAPIYVCRSTARNQKPT
jgi:hypothetical protein